MKAWNWRYCIMSRPVIEVEGLSKEFIIGARERSGESLREALMSSLAAPFRRLRQIGGNAVAEDRIWALRDVNFTVDEGEVVGIIGRNGAGKSTLLKVLSRITAPTEGRVTIRGRIGSLLEVGTGFHPELTGRENIFLNGAILGMKQKEIESKFDEIVDFSGVEKFIDTPVKRYSSGMHVRLAFAVAAHLDPEILLVDEVLAVGDAEFQRKCLGKMGDVAKSGRSIIFVSHNLGAVRNLCSRAISLNGGMVSSIGQVDKVINYYMLGSQPNQCQGDVSFQENEVKPFQLIGLRLLDSDDNICTSFSCDSNVTIECTCRVRQPVPGLYGYLLISKSDGMDILESDSFDTLPNVLDELQPGLRRFRITIPPRTLGHGEYSIYLNFSSSSLSGQSVDSPQTVARFRLDDSKSRRGNRRRGYLSTLPQWTLNDVA